jgi:hypothetical protein
MKSSALALGDEVNPMKSDVYSIGETKSILFRRISNSQDNYAIAFGRLQIHPI